jgi:hypothetical protein
LVGPAYYRRVAAIDLRGVLNGLVLVAMSWRAKIARFLIKFGAAKTRRDGVRAWHAGENIDPIEELARIINETQERDTRDEGRFDDLPLLDPPKPIRAATQPRRRVRPS